VAGSGIHIRNLVDPARTSFSHPDSPRDFWPNVYLSDLTNAADAKPRCNETGVQQKCHRRRVAMTREMASHRR